MAGVAAARGGDRPQTLGISGVALVIHQCPGTVERRGPEIVGVPAHGIAGGVAYGAIDALDGRVGSDPRGAVRPHTRNIILARLRWCEDPFGLLPLVEEGPQVGGQILDDR